MINIERTDISKVNVMKRNASETLTKLATNEATGLQLWERKVKFENGETGIYLEVIKPRLRNGVWTYPSPEDFGNPSKCIYVDSEMKRMWAEYLLENGIPEPNEYRFAYAKWRNGILIKIA